MIMQQYSSQVYPQKKKEKRDAERMLAGSEDIQS